MGGRGAEFVAFDCTSQEKAAHGHVVHAVQEVPFWAPFDAVFDTSCPGNERCAVESSAVQKIRLWRIITTLKPKLRTGCEFDVEKDDLPRPKPE